MFKIFNCFFFFRLFVFVFLRKQLYMVWLYMNYVIMKLDDLGLFEHNTICCPASVLLLTPNHKVWLKLQVIKSALSAGLECSFTHCILNITFPHGSSAVLCNLNPYPFWWLTALFLPCRLEIRMLSCTTGSWEWPFLEQRPAWLTLMDQTCNDNKFIRTHISISVSQCHIRFTLLFLKVYSQCRRCSRSVGGTGGGWFIQCPHTL